MNILSDLYTTLSALDIPIEPGVFKDEAPERYIVIVPMVMRISTALQDETLDEVIKEKVPVIVYLMNGFQLKGSVLAHDDAVAVLEIDGRHQIVYKHAISTVAPARLLKCLKYKPL